VLIYKNGTVTVSETRKPAEDEFAFLRLLKPNHAEIHHILSDMYQCHPLVIEDCVKLGQRPKVDIYHEHALLIFYGLVEDWEVVEIAIVIGKNFVITICQEELPFLAELRQEFLRIPDKMHNPGSIIYHLLDNCVDQYLDLADAVEDKVTDIENEVFEDPFAQLAHNVFRMKRKLHSLRRHIAEERNVLGTLMHSDFPYTKEEINVYLMDIYDHLSRVVDSIDTFRESMTGILELQMSLKGDRMNAIMKTLTIVSTFFLPLSFIVGLYGMNVKGVPEYSWRFGYAFVWGLLILVSATMYLVFKRKKWW
jgi:magnesium transporter